MGDPVDVAETMLEKYMTSQNSYTVYEAVDAPGNDIFQAWNLDVDVLKRLCDTDPGCAGFNSQGWMKTSVANTSPSASVTLYVKDTR